MPGLKCYRCGQERPVTEMRYTSENKMTCKHCLERGKKSVPNPEPAREQRGEMEKLSCSKCKYSFRRKKGETVKTFPYCGRAGTVEKRTGLSANDLINESLDSRYDR